MNKEPAEAVIKFEVLVKGIGSWIPADPDANIIQWLNAWLGPHWILVPHLNGIEIYRDNKLVYQGKLKDLPISKPAFDHYAAMKMSDDSIQEVTYRIAWGLEQALQNVIVPSLSSIDIQSGVQAFFNYVFE